MPILDTNFLIALADGDADAGRLLADLADQRLVVPSVVAAEFLTPYGKDCEKALQELERAFVVLHTTALWIAAAASLRHDVRRRRGTLRVADLWIAAWARMLDDVVVTRDAKHFRALGVATRSW